jgi:DNA-binding CsgD family transcriptional regulator
MDTYSNLLLEIYHAARTLPPDEFPDAVMAMLRASLNFDSARLLCTDLTSGSVVVQGSIMYNIPTDNALDWENIQRQDLVLPHVLANPGVPLSFHSPTLFAGAPHAIMRDYVQRYEHRNGLVIARPDAESGLMDGLSLYRAGADAHFGEREQHLVREVMPHLQEALKLNRQLAAPTVIPSLQGALLIAQVDGGVQYCAPQSQQLMSVEWPAWRPARLPAVLLESLRQPGFMFYKGKQIVVNCQQRLSTLLFLRLTARSPLMRLSRRELEVAGLYSRGLAAKAVAIELGITPATARNMLQKIYQKLEVHDKAALAQLMPRHARKGSGHDAYAS